MKRKYLFCFLAVLLVLTQILNSTAMVLADDTASEGDASNYESAVVIDISTGNILYEKNADKPIYPAGLMKLMTGLVALDKLSSSETVTVSKNKTLSKTISKLKSKKKYYVRIRTYKTVGKTKYYSAWSKAKNVKIK